MEKWNITVVNKTKGAHEYNLTYHICFKEMLYLFSGIKDLLDILQVRQLPEGVTLTEGRPAAFSIDSTAELHSPLSKVYRRRLPKNFSLLATIRPHTDNTGFLLTVADVDGSVKLAIQVGSNPTFQYYEHSKTQGRVIRFPVELSDGDWHFLGYSVSGNVVSLYKDCDLISTQELKKSKRPKTGPNSVITIGQTLQTNELFPNFEVSILDNVSKFRDIASPNEYFYHLLGPCKMVLVIFFCS